MSQSPGASWRKKRNRGSGASVVDMARTICLIWPNTMWQMISFCHGKRAGGDLQRDVSCQPMAAKHCGQKNEFFHWQILSPDPWILCLISKGCIQMELVVFSDMLKRTFWAHLKVHICTVCLYSVMFTCYNGHTVLYFSNCLFQVQLRRLRYCSVWEKLWHEILWGILAFADHLHARKPLTHYRKEKTL